MLPGQMNIAETQQQAAERERRQRVLKKGIASYADRSITVECMVRDLSSGGAKLQLVQPLPLPDHFDLEIPMDGINVRCVARWRDGDRIGVQFVGDISIEASKARQRVDPTGLNSGRARTLRRVV